MSEFLFFFFLDHVEDIDFVGGVRSMTCAAEVAVDDIAVDDLKQFPNGSPVLRVTLQTRRVFSLLMAAALVRPGQPWHVGERQLQLQQKTVASSDEMGPHIYHKVALGWVGGNGKLEGWGPYLVYVCIYI